MEYLKSLQKTLISKSLNISFVSSILLWLFLFRNFPLGRIPLYSDALTYYDHVIFYVDNIRKGIYPMWDPVYHYGLPNSFFLRRIGEYNPFLLVVPLLNKIGLPYDLSYNIFLIAYLFLGMAGFYMLSKLIFKDSRIAFTAYLLLLFSSFGASLINNYLIFVFTPGVWFFYFFVAFTRSSKRLFALGMTFSVMIAVITYVPFYFLTVVLCFLIFFTFLYFRDLKKILLRYKKFIFSNKLFCCFCLFILIMSLLPGLMFFAESKKQEFVLPLRNYGSTISNPISVSLQKAEPGIISHVKFETLLSYLDKFRPGRFYIPIFAYLIFLLGIFTFINKKLILFFTMCFMLALIGLADANSLYGFLYKYVFFFKYFRNLWYFLWVGLLQIFVLFLTEQFRLILEYSPKTEKEKRVLLTFLLVVHIGFTIFLLIQQDIIISSYLVVGLSLIFFMLQFFRHSKIKKTIFPYVILVLVATQSVEVYYYLNKNFAQPKQVTPFSHLPRLGWNKDISQPVPIKSKKDSTDLDDSIDLVPKKMSSVYFSTKRYSQLLRGLGECVLNKYVRYKFIVYDNVERINEEDLDFKKIEESFLELRNVAFISSQNQPYGIEDDPRKYSPYAQVVTGDTEGFELVSFDTNSIKIKTDFDSKKFLVYNDNFYSGWQAFINGKKTDILIANVAFKGVCLPPGKNIVYFRFGSKLDYFIRILLIIVFNVVLVYLLILWARYISLRNLKQST